MCVSVVRAGPRLGCSAHVPDHGSGCPACSLVRRSMCGDHPCAGRRARTPPRPRPRPAERCSGSLSLCMCVGVCTCPAYGVPVPRACVCTEPRWDPRVPRLHAGGVVLGCAVLGCACRQLGVEVHCCPTLGVRVCACACCQSLAQHIVLRGNILKHIPKRTHALICFL